MKNRALISICLLLTLTTACGKKKVNMTPAASVPAANGNAVLTKDSNGNTVVDLKVQHLAKPQNLTPPKNVYVVWIQPRGGAATNEGELRVNDNLQAEFKTPTTYKTFDIFVTAEDNASATQPTGPEVLRQTVTAS
ncbi:MAG TPA: hypothetical protein VFA89_12000 [Terriglobales bacterium]|nr:hypothetical protein [Terriglobales bacterium]